jgi:hypothetical protein
MKKLQKTTPDWPDARVLLSSQVDQCTFVVVYCFVYSRLAAPHARRVGATSVVLISLEYSSSIRSLRRAHICRRPGPEASEAACNSHAGARNVVTESAEPSVCAAVTESGQATSG